jgi:uncharacterized membrane protein YeaQ/YmgE (transglycosylase-associated protein family)
LAVGIGGKIVNRKGSGIILDIVIGALVGGWLFELVGHAGATGIILYSIFVAFVGAVAVLVV